MKNNTDDWTGNVVEERHHIEHLAWGWGDPYCKSRVRTILTYRYFFTNPNPPITQKHFSVIPYGEKTPIECYSNGKFLIALECKEEKEWQYFPSFWDRVKALFVKNNRREE